MTDKLLFENKWATVIDRDGWVVVRDMDGLGVAVLPYRIQGRDLWYLCRMEPCPSHGPCILPSSLTGGLKEGEEPAAAAARELYEEAGYQVPLEHLIPLGEVWPSKLVELRVFLFAANVTGLEHTKPKGDGSSWEALASNVWYRETQALTVPDAVWGTMILRLKAKLRG